MAKSQFKINNNLLEFQPTNCRWSWPPFNFTMDGQVRTQGKPRCTWVREASTQAAVDEWFSYIGDDYSVSVNIDTWVPSGTSYTWVTYNGVMLRPTIEDSSGLIHSQMSVEFIQLEKA